MADVWQEEIGNPHGVKGILATPEEDDEPEVTLFGVGPPVMTTKEIMMPHLTVKKAMGVHIHLEDLGVFRALWDLTDLGH